MSHFIKFVSNMLSGKTGEMCSSENKAKREVEKREVNVRDRVKE